MATDQSTAVFTHVEYRDIVGLAGYRVGTDGSVWSRWRPGGRPAGKRLTLEWRQLVGKAQNGYRCVALSSGGRTVLRRVHILVLEAFVGPCPAGMETRHLNGIKADNRLGNLAWGTPLENAQDRERHGHQLKGSAQPCSVLTEAIVSEIIDAALSGEPRKPLARRVGIDRGHLGTILRGESWAHVRPEVLRPI